MESVMYLFSYVRYLAFHATIVILAVMAARIVIGRVSKRLCCLLWGIVALRRCRYRKSASVACYRENPFSARRSRTGGRNRPPKRAGTPQADPGRTIRRRRHPADLPRNVQTSHCRHPAPAAQIFRPRQKTLPAHPPDPGRTIRRRRHPDGTASGAWRRLPETLPPLRISAGSSV